VREIALATGNIKDTQQNLARVEKGAIMDGKGWVLMVAA